MLNLLRIERRKIVRFIPLYVSLAIMILMWADMLTTSLKDEYIEMYGPLTMHDGFGEGIQDCSFSFLYGMLIAWFIGIDFTNRTVHKAIVTGNSRWKIVVAKLISTSVVVMIFHFISAVLETLLYGKQFGFSFEGFSIKDLAWLGVIMLQLIAYNAFYELVTIICGNVYIALFASITTAAVLGNVLRNYLGGNFIYEHSFFCLAKSSSAADLIPCAVCAIIAAVLLVLASCFVFNKKDVAN